MLVLTRKTGEKIRVVGPEGEIIDLEVINYPSESQVRIGVDAPQKYRIHRVNRAGMIEKEPSRYLRRRAHNGNS